MKKSLVVLLACGALLCAKEKQKEAEAPVVDSALTTVEEEALPVRVAKPVKAKDNAVRYKTNWYVQVDEFGSTVDTGRVLNSGGMVSAIFEMAPLANDEDWPYAELVCELGGTIEKFESIAITYECNTDILLKLIQSDFSDEGNETYSYYEFVLPKANWMHTETVKVKSFSQPGWAPEESKSIPLVVGNVTGLQIVPDLDEIIGGSASIKVKTLKFYSGK